MEVQKHIKNQNVLSFYRLLPHERSVYLYLVMQCIFPSRPFSRNHEHKNWIQQEDNILKTVSSICSWHKNKVI